MRTEYAQVVHKVTEMSNLMSTVRASGRSVGFVPTMGSLHAGHLSLVSRARNECDLVAVSVFVNPLQFDSPSDLAAYPRDPDGDTKVAFDAGAHVVFMPSEKEMYPVEPLTVVRVGGISEQFEGSFRPGHFDGVATVVTKLLAIVGPCKAYFGEKDFQQLVLVKRLVKDLSFPVEVVGCETVREADGLALSSRNALLDPEDRRAAPILYKALRAGVEEIAKGNRSPVEVRDVMVAVVSEEKRALLDYADVVDPTTFVVPKVISGEERLVIAARFGAVRLIDNMSASKGIGGGFD
ncbi:MAG: pantoate--beta-alanine ligase [Actinobacteria bacterium]|nr:pantoate--beta-alanine ligase [Actinomycetota bacterium]MCL6095758.1 pantoate--beta-alanine ligase [Actinomycetota bacterium]